MQSPFPGMDPYIESGSMWEDFHQKLIGEIETALAASVPERYVVRLGERTYVVLATADEAGIKRHMTQADVTVSLVRRESAPPEPGGVAILEPQSEAATEPVEMTGLVEVEFREAFVEIYELEPKRRLVTSVEVLSPSNKRRDTTGWIRYQRKRQAHLEGNANLVEIDLLRGGQRMPMEDQWPNSPYYVLVCRREKAPVCTVWPAHYTLPLPEISVPLAPPDPDVSLELQGMVDEIYKRSRYHLDIEYDRPCKPRLGEAGEQWLAERLRAS